MQRSKCRFNILKEKFGPHTAYNLVDNHSGELVCILPFMGGAVNRILLKKDDKLIDIIDGYNSIDEIRKTLLFSFKGSNLFPFPNRIANGSYVFNNEKHHLLINFPQQNNAIHGLVYDKEFDVLQVEPGESECCLVLGYVSSGDLPGYPFQFRMQQRYRWSDKKGFECTTTIENLSDYSIPLGHGYHPYFKIGLRKINDLYLRFKAITVLEVDQENIPTGKLVKYQKFDQIRQIGTTVLDNCFQLDTSRQCAEVTLSDMSRDIQVNIWMETGKNKYNYLQVFTPPGRDSIAIEPMTCAPDAFNSGEGLIVLPSAERLSFSWGVSP